MRLTCSTLPEIELLVYKPLSHTLEFYTGNDIGKGKLFLQSPDDGLMGFLDEVREIRPILLLIGSLVGANFVSEGRQPDGKNEVFRKQKKEEQE